MASPVSFGDAVAMSKIAWRIAHAFTKGRTSAPAEFREVENQLYSLSAALTAFKDVCGTDVAAVAIDPSQLPARFHDEKQDGGHTVSRILDSCGETLAHLEKIVDEYAVVATPSAKDPAKSRLQRWTADLVKNYKKIAWTTEAGDLAALRSQLMVHTNSLDLVLGIIVSSRTTRIEESLTESSVMLKEIHAWWAQNLKDVSAAKKPTWGNNLLGLKPEVEPLSFVVSVVECPKTFGVSWQLCSKARLRDNWRETTSSPLFICGCNNATGPKPRRCRVETISLSPFSFPFRLAGHSLAWTVFKVRDDSDRSPSQLVSIIISDVAPSDVLEFEKTFIRPLAEATAGAMSQQGIANQLVHLSPDGQHIRTLNLQTKLTHKLIDTVTFRVGHRSLSKPTVDGLSLFNYCELGHPKARESDTAMDYAELSIYYGSQGAQETAQPADITKSIVHLTGDTVLKIEESSVSVIVEAAKCLGFAQDQQVNRLEKADVVFHMISLEAAKQLLGAFEDMRMELFVNGLKYPRSDEVVALHLQATEVQCEVAIIPDAELLITRSKQDTYRLIVRSRDRCTVLTQVLPDSFFASPASDTPSFTSPTWFVTYEGMGGACRLKQRAYHYPNGFRHLSFRNTSFEKMFELGRTAVLNGVIAQPLPIREKAEDMGVSLTSAPGPS